MIFGGVIGVIIVDDKVGGIVCGVVIGVGIGVIVGDILDC